MTNEYKFDAARWLRNIAEVQSHRAGAGAAMLRENMLKCAEEIELRSSRVARLEEALKEISTLYWVDAPAPEEMRRIARRALEEK